MGKNENLENPDEELKDEDIAKEPGRANKTIRELKGQLKDLKTQLEGMGDTVPEARNDTAHPDTGAPAYGRRAVRAVEEEVDVLPHSCATACWQADRRIRPRSRRRACGPSPALPFAHHRARPQALSREGGLPFVRV